MFGNNEYWWAGLLIFLLFVALNTVIFLLRNNPKLSYAISYSIAGFLLVYKITEYIYWQAIGEHLHFPVEFSALSYFVFAIFTVFRLKKIDGFASFTAILAGMFYSISFWVSPDSFISSMETKFLFATAIINHHLLYTAGMLMLMNVRKFKPKNFYQHFIGAGLMVAYSWIIHLFTDYTAVEGKPIIIQITDGSILNWLFHSANPTGGTLALYYVVTVLLFCLVVAGYYGLNRLSVKRRVKAGLPEEYFPEKLSEAFKPCCD